MGQLERCLRLTQCLPAAAAVSVAAAVAAARRAAAAARPPPPLEPPLGWLWQLLQQRG